MLKGVGGTIEGKGAFFISCSSSPEAYSFSDHTGGWFKVCKSSRQSGFSFKSMLEMI